MAGVVLFLVLAGHLAILAYAKHHHLQLWLAMAMLCSGLTLPPPPLLPSRRHTFLRRAWRVFHVTYSDDILRSALCMLLRTAGNVPAAFNEPGPARQPGHFVIQLVVPAGAAARHTGGPPSQGQKQHRRSLTVTMSSRLIGSTFMR